MSMKYNYLSSQVHGNRKRSQNILIVFVIADPEIRGVDRIERLMEESLGLPILFLKKETESCCQQRSGHRVTDKMTKTRYKIIW
ncbi:hypothetical protein HN011_000245 [Eciton burchellii]|nr:hypothetical protein HN011_000245 [Eciton burchellii]